VLAAECAFKSPTNQQFDSCQALAPASGSRNNGTFSCNASIFRYAEAGTWTAYVFAVDFAGNLLTLPPSGLTGLGFPADLSVAAVPDDVAGPVQSSFTFAPLSVDVSSTFRKVTCSFTLTDSPAGVASAGCTLALFGSLQTQSCNTTFPASGNPNSGVYTCDVTIPAYSGGGIWTATANYADAVGNISYGSSVAILNVSCAGGSAETIFVFNDKQTLGWNAVAGATTYNLYRGTKSTPGTAPMFACLQSGLATTSATDATTPAAGGSPFFYLVDYKSGGVEQGLGTDSSGAARTVTSACP
jgi:hypothetical protein